MIVRDVLGLDITQSEEIPDDMQHTKERKPDALKKVTDATGHTYVLQVEFQTADEKEMVYRMAEYSVMLMRSNVEQQFEKAMETVTKFFKEEKDFLYKKGEVKGREEGREEKELKFVTNLVAQSDLSDQQIAGMAEVPLSFVKSVRNSLKK